MYYVYHIPGVKIGCSTTPKRRAQSKGYSDYEILETHTDINIASQRELELQKEYNYPIDTIPYKTSYEKRLLNRTIKDCIRGGKTQGKINAINGHLDKVRIPKNGGIAACSIVRKCQYCNKEVRGPSYFKNHADNCKHKI